jgi:hypothetical protein
VNESVPVLDDAVPFRDDLVVDLNDAIKKRRPELNDIAAARLKVYVRYAAGADSVDLAPGQKVLDYPSTDEDPLNVVSPDDEHLRISVVGPTPKTPAPSE